MTTIKLTLDRKLPGINSFLHESKKEQAQIKRDIGSYIVKELFRQNCVPDEVYAHIKISAVFCEVQEGRDPDNIIFGLKFLNDSLICAGLVEDDGIAQISFGSFDFKPHCKNYKAELSFECTEFKN